MRVLVFRHSPAECLGRIADSLESHGIASEASDIRSCDGVILMGGPMSANDDSPFIRRALDVVAEAAALGKPILGVCLGSQLIAKALGARVYRNPVKEIGWAPVSWTGAGQREFSLDGPETVFHWHGETFDLPDGAELLAYSQGCRHQAFRLGNIYGLQFHLEVTPPMVADWVAEDAGREVTSPIDPHENCERLKEVAGKVFGRWCDIARACGKRTDL